VFRYNALIEYGGFYPKLGPLCDSFTTQVMALQKGFCFIPEPLAAKRLTACSYSNDACICEKSSSNITRNAAVLMETKYSAFFPEQFVTEWKKIRSFSTAANIWRQKINKRRRNSLPVTLSSWIQFFIFILHSSLFFFEKSSFSEIFFSLARFVAIPNREISECLKSLLRIEKFIKCYK
ncbi:hypothetical protein ACFL7E_08350, partial [Thermodesulfobacteriota bacterium]